MAHNDLTGPIPSFENFANLGILDLSWNHLSGPVPKSFRNMTELGRLDLSHNNLSGQFPDMSNERISIIDLSYNRFQLGTIPNWIIKSQSMSIVKMVKCGIKSSLDSWKPGDSKTLDLIDLSENEIRGSLMGLFNGTTFLRYFSVTGNLLKFDLGRLKIPKLLETLELSRNLAYGKVPKKVRRLAYLNMSYNHLCGKLPATKFSPKSFEGNDCLCGSPLSPCKV